MDPEIVISFFVFWFGASIGSFLNVCIHRMPREMSIIRPRSSCPHCKALIPWYWNIPLVSYLWLRGHCGRCKRSISIRYFAIELASGIFWLFLWGEYGPSVEFATRVLFFSLLFVAIVTDFETGLIPDQITLPGMVAGLVLAVAGHGQFAQGAWSLRFLDSFLGLLAGGAILFVTGWLGTLVFKKESMGGGDIKLLAMIGAFIGLKHVCLAFLLAPFPALPLALWQRFVKKEETIPYGPFLALAGIALFLYAGPIDRFITEFYGV
ncbi:MAG: prepilin peptidase [Candidatus Omnitrophica bacterium]|nr:prepilin peptidase [Candidatus Omnitrophota bacterium]